MNSIRLRLLFSFMFIIMITVVILEIFLIANIKQNHYQNLEDNLTNQLQVSAELYIRYFSDASLHENVLNNVDTFWKQVTAQVEIIDMQGNVLMDSIGYTPEDVGSMEDVKKALDGSIGKWVGKVPYDVEEVMAISYPIVYHDKQLGVLRFIASLREVNKDIRRISYNFITVGISVVFISGLVSIILASTITGPLKAVTKVAEEMARGNLRVRSRKRSKDEIGRLSDTLNFMASELVKKEQLKNEFISSVSHELRTPLTSIKGWAVTLKQGYVDAEMLADGLDIIEKESDRLTNMVGELLDFSKFVSQKITLENKPTSIPIILDHLNKQLTPRATRDQIHLDISYGTENPTIMADENRLKQVFINLLDNAFKFTDAGGKVTVHAQYEDKKYTIIIQDTGLGISPEELPKVKERFYKGKTSKSQNGIGLSISDELIRLMQGELVIESEELVGTTITIILPVKEEV